MRILTTISIMLALLFIAALGIETFQLLWVAAKGWFRIVRGWL